MVKFKSNCLTETQQSPCTCKELSPNIAFEPLIQTDGTPSTKSCLSIGWKASQQPARWISSWQINMSQLLNLTQYIKNGYKKKQKITGAVFVD